MYYISFEKLQLLNSSVALKVKTLGQGYGFWMTFKPTTFQWQASNINHYAASKPYPLSTHQTQTSLQSEVLEVSIAFLRLLCSFRSSL